MLVVSLEITMDVKIFLCFDYVGLCSFGGNIFCQWLSEGLLLREEIALPVALFVDLNNGMDMNPENSM